jgi:predicted ATPase
MERLDRLPTAKRVAQLGAAIGRSFSHDLLVALSETPDKALRFALEQLIASGLLVRRGLRRRAAIHERIVELRQARGSEDPKPDLLAYHCDGWRSNDHAAYEDSREQFRNALRLAATLPECKTRYLSELRALRGIGWAALRAMPLRASLRQISVRSNYATGRAIHRNLWALT